MMKKRVLVVEDNALNREILSEILSGDYEVLKAENGQVALDILKQYKTEISLVLLDVIMPVMDGFTFLDLKKEDEDIASIPVIVMTQNSNEEDEISALAHGATDFVPKPYRAKIILHRVAAIIKLRETAAMMNQLQYDRLTGLYTREYFYQKAQELIRENPSNKYCIFSSSIENFKLIKANFGIYESQQLLKKVASIVLEAFEKDGFCGRYSTDRFICIKKCENGKEDMYDKLQGVVYNVSSVLTNVFLKWGVYEVTDRALSIDQMCDRAILAMESIKNIYNKTYAVYDEQFHENYIRERTIASAMETALAEGQFTVYYQPKYSLRDNNMSGAEALVRWIHPEWGFMPPGEFIPLFEKNGFILKLDEYVWEEVCKQLYAWKKKGHLIVPVSVNVSRADMFNDDLAHKIYNLVRKYDLEPACLHLEITESAYADRPGKIISTVNKFRQLGFIVEMDDFGSGYSSLNMLARMSLDILKLDMKFIQNEVEKPAEFSLLGDVINMAHHAHLSVVAEGVETREQLDRLKAVGCDYAQGFFFAKPMPSESFELLLEEWKPEIEKLKPKEQRSDLFQQGILLIDEDEEYRKQAVSIFSEQQYIVYEASNKEEAIEVLKTVDVGTLSTIILSMTLPDGGANNIFDILRQTPTFWDIPVLATIPSGSCLNRYPLAIDADDFLCKCHPLMDLHRRVRRMMEIAIYKRRESVLQDEASHDPLTGLLNRRGFNDEISRIRVSETPLAICVFDLDNLKIVNDSFGHDAGDKLLCSFADLLNSKIRKEDIKCRLGGDEFVVVLKHMKDKDLAMKKVDEICDMFAQRNKAEGLPSACSVGVVMCGQNEKVSAKMVERADRALYHAKRYNKGGSILWQENMNYPQGEI